MPGVRVNPVDAPFLIPGLPIWKPPYGRITAFNLNTGAKVWRTPTVNEDLDSTNVGGGLCWDGSTLYAVNGMAELLALDAAKGAVRWRHGINVPARSAPTVAALRSRVTRSAATCPRR